jgi:hypothetical protein
LERFFSNSANSEKGDVKMDVTKPVTDLVASLNWNLILPLIQAMVVFFLVLWIKNYIVSLYAWFQFKGSLNIGYGTWVRIPTSNSHVDGQITQANRHVIRIDTKDTRIFIPTKSFRERDWALLKKDAFDKDEEKSKNET